MKFLFDQCLSPTLAMMAVKAGYPESAHVLHRGMSSRKDHSLIHRIIDGDWTFVTRNSDDFRPRPGSSSKKPVYVGQQLHAGLVCLNLPANAELGDHHAYFREALNSIAVSGDLVNRILEVDPDLANPGCATSRIYDFPHDENHGPVQGGKGRT